MRWIFKLFNRYYPDWVYTNQVIKWTLENAKHLDHTDTYYIEKKTDDCLIELRKKETI